MCYMICVCEEDRIAKEVVDAAVKLHKHFGPGVFETVYEPVLLHELKKRNLTTRHQIPVPLVYEGLTFDVAFKMDVVVNELVILELKIGQEAGTRSFQAASYLPPAYGSTSGAVN
jgi:GxxExxY protein